MKLFERNKVRYQHLIFQYGGAQRPPFFIRVIQSFMENKLLFLYHNFKTNLMDLRNFFGARRTALKQLFSLFSL